MELVEHNIEVFYKNTQSNENISITQGNAMDLSVFPDNKYDITLLLGPLYHLYNKEDKQQALHEAIRVTKPGGGFLHMLYLMAVSLTRGSIEEILMYLNILKRFD